MSVLLRVVLDQLVTATDPDLAMASGELARALVRTAPSGCEVGAMVPAGVDDLGVDGLAQVRRLAMGRRELAAAWQLGVTAGAGGGLVHSPTLLAPLGRHDRVNDHDQVVVTIWDLRPWQHPDELSRSAALWHRAMLSRARKHADAVVVPTHAMSRALERIAHFGGRTRVIAGAAPTGFRVPTDAVGRRRTLGIPEAVIALVGGTGPSSGTATGLRAIAASGVDLPVVVLGGFDGDDGASMTDAAADAGLPPERLHAPGRLDDADRAAVLDAAVLLVAPGRRSAFPWRAVEAMALGVPVIAVASPDHREVVWDAGRVVGAYDGDTDDVDALAAAVSETMGDALALERLAVLSGDRGRAYSWPQSADRVWQLHADL